MRIGTIVHDYYETPGIAEAYARKTSLMPPEEMILERLRDELAGARVLDVGVGAGRTTPWLRAIAGSYVGIDYSERMLELCRRNHPDAELLHCDARRLPFGDASFDAVFIPFNALDDVGHEDRIAIFRETRRVLRDEGALVFSSHNRRCARRSPYRPPRFVRTGGLASSARHNAAAFAKYVRGVVNHLGAVRHERREAEYAILNDQSYSYRLLAYYIAPERQRAQLARAGFRLELMAGTDGRELVIGEEEGCRDGWVYYVARREKEEIDD